MRLKSVAKRVLFGVAAATIALTVCGERADAQIKLNGPLVGGGWVEPGSVQFSPDSSRVLYRADQEFDEVFELYSVPSVGGTPVKLNGPLPAGGDAFEAQFSSDSARVLYRAIQDMSGVSEVYVVPSVGGAPLKLNGPLVSGGTVSGVQFTPDSTRAVYTADQDTDGVVELYSVSSTGGASVKLNDPLAGAFLITPQLITSDSARAVYQLFDLAGPIEIFSVPTSGGTVVTLNGPLVPGGDAGPFEDSVHLSPAGDRVLYLADQDVDEVFEIYSVPAAGGTPVKLNGALTPGGDVEVSGLQFSPDSSRVLYMADQDADEVREIYSVPSSGGTPVKLNGAMTTGGDVLAFSSQFSPDSSHVLYRADQDTDDVFEIYSVPSAGGTPVKLNAPLVSGGDVQNDGLEFSHDSSQVLYRADQETDGVTELYNVPATGGVPVKLNAPLAAGRNVAIAEFSPDSSRVLYIADHETDQVHEIYLVPSTGGTPVKLNGPLVPGGLGISFITPPHFSPDGNKVLYVADQDTFGVFEAYVRIVRERANNGGGDWDTTATWDQGFTPDEVMQVVVDTSATVTATGNASLRVVNDVVIGGGPGTSTLELASGASISTLNGLSIQPGGVLRGDGRILGDVTNALGGEVRAQTGDTLTLSGTDAVNGGSVYLQGGTLEIDSPLTIATGGEILGRGTLMTDGLTNEGRMLLSAGVTDVFGSVDNAGGGEIIVSGLATATFFDDVVHNGDEIRTSAGSATVFFGDVTGSGPYTGSGAVFYEGTFSPGSSPAAVLIEGSAGFGSGSLLEIELGGPTPADDYDQLLIGGAATLDGTLDVSLIDAFFPTPGETFEIMTFASHSGEFATVTGDVGLLDPTTFLLPLYSSTNLLLFTAIPGDGNLSGTVEAGDYTLWANEFGIGDEFTEGDYNGDGTVGPADYTIWANNFGLMSSAPSNAPAAVPEPSTWMLLSLGFGSILLPRRRFQRRRRA